MRSNDDVGSSAGDYSLDLRLLGLRHSELVKRLLQIVEKGFPLLPQLSSDVGATPSWGARCTFEALRWPSRPFP